GPEPAPPTARARRGRRRPSRAGASLARPLVGALDGRRHEAPPAREELAAHRVAGRGAPAGRPIGTRLEGDEVGGVVNADLQRALPGILEGDGDGEYEAHAIAVQARAKVTDRRDPNRPAVDADVEEVLAGLERLELRPLDRARVRRRQPPPGARSQALDDHAAEHLVVGPGEL